MLSGFVRIRFCKDYFWQATNFSVPLIIHLLAPIIILTFDRFIIANNGKPGELGTYFVAWQVSMPIMLLGDAINKAIKPWSSQKIQEGDYKVVNDATRKIIILLCPICIVAVATIHYGYGSIVGGNYVNGRSFATILVISAFVHISYYPLCSFLYFKEQTKVITSISIGSALLYVVCAVNLYPYFGTIILPIASVITNILFVCAIAVKNSRAQKEYILNATKNH